MTDDIRHALRNMLIRYGFYLVEDASQFSSVANDLLPGHRAERELVSRAVAAGAGRALLRGPHSTAARSAIAERLVIDAGFSADDAQWVVSTLADALGHEVTTATGPEDETERVPDADVLACIVALIRANGSEIATSKYRENLRILLNHEMPGFRTQIERTLTYVTENPAALASLVPPVDAPVPAPGSAPPAPPPGPPPLFGQPDSDQFPAASTPGQPPSRLPTPPAIHREPHPIPPHGDWRDPVLDTPLEHRREQTRTWASRLLVVPPPGWALTHHIDAIAGHLFQLRDDGGSVITDQQTLRMTAIYSDTESLPSAGDGHPMLSRMRMLHRRSFGDGAWTPAGTPEWRTLLGRPAVMDHFGRGDQQPWGFSLATDLGDGYGAVVIAGGPPLRANALAVALESAPTLELMPGPERCRMPQWQLGPGWKAQEEVQVSTNEVVARITLEMIPPVYADLDPEAKLDAWEEWVFQTSNPVRGMRTLGSREVSIPGLSSARLRRFDYQPSGRGRSIVNLVVGIVGEDRTGFTYLTESWAGDEAAYIQPDLLLERVRVLGPLPAQ